MELIAERALKESQKQAYVTAQKDFESLLDFVDAKTKNDTVDKETPPKLFKVVNEGTGVWRYGRIWGYCVDGRTFVFSFGGETEDYRVDLNAPSLPIVPAKDGTMDEIPQNDLELALLIFMSSLRVGILTLDILTMATEPLTANDISEKIALETGIYKDDNFNLEHLERMVFASLERLKKFGDVEKIERDGIDTLWKIKS